ncbi:hypothetical protein [Kordia sp.]|uniref:hypothetical protein n=1 Tax=Kordia sp. TaxID=1965332 RepID=UPI0025B94C3F|nr:hypothetical protein [Kordia sp.]MCH2194382.1 hypothetical protein [Kordia sp.]
MKITVSNYKEQVPLVDWKKINNPELQDLANDGLQVIEFYSNDIIKQQIDDTIELINKSLKSASNPCKEEKVTQKKYVPKKAAPKKVSNTRKTKAKKIEKIDPNIVSHYSNEFMLIRRFYSMVKKDEYTTFRKIQLLFQAFQKAAVSRKTRKSAVSELYKKVFDKVTLIYNQVEVDEADANVNLKSKALVQQLKEYVEESTINYAITLLNSFIRLQGTTPEESKVQNLINRIEKSIEKGKVKATNRLYDELIEAKKYLNKYLKNPKEKIEVKPFALSGPPKKKDVITIPAPPVEMIVPLDLETPKNIISNVNVEPLPNKKAKQLSGIITSNDLMKMHFETIKMDEGWEDLLQEPAKTLKIAVYGNPKNGKTSGVCAFADYLARKHGDLLYVFADQGFCKSTQDIWRENNLHLNPNASPSNIRTLKELDDACKTGKYKFIVIDMINYFIENEKLRVIDFKKDFVLKYPNISFIYILEVTKGEKFKGEKGWEHLPDAIFEVKDFLIENRGRYGNGHYIIWEEEFKKRNPQKYKELTQPETITI